MYKGTLIVPFIQLNIDVPNNRTRIRQITERKVAK